MQARERTMVENKEVYLNHFPLDITDYDTQSYTKFKAMYYKSNHVNASGCLLLIFFFYSNEEMRMVQMFPEFCCCNIAFGTKRETKRAIYFAIG